VASKRWMSESLNLDTKSGNNTDDVIKTDDVINKGDDVIKKEGEFDFLPWRQYEDVNAVDVDPIFGELYARGNNSLNGKKKPFSPFILFGLKRVS